MQTDQPILPRWLSVAIYVTVAVVLLVLLLVHATGIWQWRVDVPVFALAGILLVIPIADRVHKLRVGKYIEAEFNELKSRVDHFGIDVSNLRDQTFSPDESPTTSPGDSALPAESDSLAEEGVARTIRQIVWVDDAPAGNRLEINELERRFDVITATSTKQGLSKITTPDATMVITDAVRVEAGNVNYEAGLELINALRERYPAVPVYVYCGQDTVEAHSQALETAGARLITSSFTELARQIRADARSSFEAEVAAMLREMGEVSSQDAGVDFVVTIAGRRIGVEAKDYRRTPKGGPFDAAINRLVEAIEAGKIDLGILVTPRDVVVAKQRERTPATVEILSVDELPHAFEQTALAQP